MSNTDSIVGDLNNFVLASDSRIDGIIYHQIKKGLTQLSSFVRLWVAILMVC